MGTMLSGLLAADSHDGYMRVTEDAWEDLRFPATAINPPGQVSDPTFNTTYVTWDYDNTEILFMVGQMPHAWKEGTTIYPHVHWQPSNTSVATPTWTLSYTWRNVTDAWASMTDVAQAVTPNGTARKAQIDNIGTGIAGTGMKVSSMLSMKLAFTTGSFTGLGQLIEFDIHYQVDSFGSDQVTSKTYRS